MGDQTEDFEMVWQRMEYATDEHAKILVVNADLRDRIAKLQAENERLKADKDQCSDLVDIADKRIAELGAQIREDSELIEAQKREIEVLQGVRDENERLRDLIKQSRQYAKRVGEIAEARHDEIDGYYYNDSVQYEIYRDAYAFVEAIDDAMEEE